MEQVGSREHRRMFTEVCTCCLSPQVEFGGLSQNCGNAPDLASQKQRTKPLIPEMCFTSTGCSTDINLSTPYLEEDGTSLLVSCKKCSVRVHASECLSPFPCALSHGAWAFSLEVLVHTGLPATSCGLPCLPVQRLLMCPWGLCRD